MAIGATSFIGILAIAAGLVAAPVAAYPLHDVGWEGTTWGMTASEVTNLMAARGFALVTGSPWLHVPFGGDIPLQTKVDIDGHTYDVAFRFSDRTGGLDAVLIAAVAGSLDGATALHHSLHRALTAQYGPATGADSRDRATNSLTRWTFKKSSIALHLDSSIDARGHRVRQVSIVYLPTAASDRREDDEGMLLLLLMQMLGKGRR